MRLLCLLALLPALAFAQDPTPPKEAPPVNDKDPEGLARWSGNKAGGGDGPLSTLFPEVELKVTTSFAHNRGMMRKVEEIKVGGEVVTHDEALPRLLQLRKGWTRDGESTDEAILETAAAWGRAWAAVYDAKVATDEEAPPEVADLLSCGPAPRGPGEPKLPMPPLSYHPPRVSLHELADGGRVVVYAQFSTYDAGNHGTGLSYDVEAYRVSDGTSYSVPSRGREFEEGQVQPKDPASFPRSASMTLR